MELTQSEINSVLQHYAVGECQTIKKISRGSINYNWLLTTRMGTYVLRAAPSYRSRKELLFEHAFLRALSVSFPYAIPNPIETVAGKTLCTHKRRIFWLYSFIPGEVVMTTTNDQVKQVAKMMAIMHTQSERMRIADGKKWPHVLNKKRLLLNLTIIQQKLRVRRTASATFFADYIAIIKEGVQAVDAEGYAALPRFPIHADIYNQNMIFYKGKLTAVLDFDNSHFDTAIADIGCYLQSSCRKGFKLDLVKAKLFLTEYRQHRALSRQEVRFLADVTIMGYAGSFYFYSQASIRKPGETNVDSADVEKLLKKSMNATKWCAENRTQIQAALV